MWLNSYKIRELEERLKLLECKINSPQGFEVYEEFKGYVSKHPNYKKISFEDAIRALAAKIGFKFEYKQGTPQTVELTNFITKE